MASSVSGPEPVFARIRRLRVCLSPGRLIPELQRDSGSDLNRSGTIPGVPGGKLGASATGLTLRLTEINLQQALGGRWLEQARLRGRKFQGLLLSKTTAETALTDNQLRTENTISSAMSIFQQAGLQQAGLANYKF